jgi:hypothetical protein
MADDLKRVVAWKTFRYQAAFGQDRNSTRIAHAVIGAMAEQIGRSFHSRRLRSTPEGYGRQVARDLRVRFWEQIEEQIVSVAAHDAKGVYAQDP